MKATVDRAGKITIPKAIREALGLRQGSEVEVALEDEHAVISPLVVAEDVPKHVERRGRFAVVVADGPIPPLTEETVNATLERIRTRHIEPDDEA